VLVAIGINKHNRGSRKILIILKNDVKEETKDNNQDKISNFWSI